MTKKEIGKVVEYFDHINIATVELSADIKLGDEIVFKKDDQELTQTIESIQVEDEAVDKAGEGDIVGIEVHEAIEPGTKIYAK